MEHSHLAKIVQASQAMSAGKQAVLGATTPAETITETSFDHVMDPAARDALALLVHQHQEYDNQLHALMAKPWLSEDEKMEEVRLKKLKLRQKDAIARLCHEMHHYTGKPLEQ